MFLSCKANVVWIPCWCMFVHDTQRWLQNYGGLWSFSSPCFTSRFAVTFALPQNTPYKRGTSQEWGECCGRIPNSWYDQKCEDMLQLAFWLYLTKRKLCFRSRATCVKAKGRDRWGNGGNDCRRTFELSYPFTPHFCSSYTSTQHVAL